MMKMMKKMYRVFNELHESKELARQVLAGWEHKEKITEVYAVADAHTLNQPFINLESDYIYLARTEQEALAEMEEMN